MDPRTATLKRLEFDTDDEVVRKARAWLARGDTRPLSDGPAVVTVNEASHLWRLRHQLSYKNGKHIYGAEGLLSNLALLAPNRKLEQFGFAGEELAGNIFFEKTRGNYVGAILVDRKEKQDFLHSKA